VYADTAHLEAKGNNVMVQINRFELLVKITTLNDIEQSFKVTDSLTNLM